MLAVIQRVNGATVFADGVQSGEIGKGLYILLGVKKGDERLDATMLAEKISKLRIFSDENDKMNLSIKDIGIYLNICTIGNAQAPYTFNGIFDRDDKSFVITHTFHDLHIGALGNILFCISISIAVSQQEFRFAGFPLRGQQDNSGNSGKIPAFCDRGNTSASAQGVGDGIIVIIDFFDIFSSKQLPGAVQSTPDTEGVFCSAEFLCTPSRIIIIGIVVVITEFQKDIGTHGKSKSEFRKVDHSCCCESHIAVQVDFQCSL